MKSYIRFLSRNKLYTAIEVVGLSLALAFVIPLISYYTNIAKISKGHENYENIYNFVYDRVQASSPGFGRFLKERVPEIERVTSPILDNRRGYIEETYRRIYQIDKEFFYFFPGKFIEGSADFLEIPDAIAVSKEFADFLSPEGSVIGRAINTGWHNKVIAAVFDEFGSGVLSECDILESNESIIEESSSDVPRAHRGSMTIFSVNGSADVKTVREKVIKAAIEYWGAKDAKYEDPYLYDIIRYDRMTTDRSAHISIKENSTETSIILGVLCLVLFIIPLLNYINLNIALTSRRAKEMAMRKLNGASRKSIILKYCAESLAFTALCFLFGLLLSKWTSRTLTSFVFNSGMGDSDFTLTWTAANILIFIGLIIITGLICGIIPAMMASRFSPLDVTKGDFRYHSKKTLSRIFIGFQSLLSVILISITLLMETQYVNLKKVTYNCDIEDVFWYAPRTGLFKTEEMLEALKSRPEILKIGITDGIPGLANTGMETDAAGEDHLYATIVCDKDAFEAFGFEILSQNGNDSKDGIWLTPSAEKTFNEHPGLFEKILEVNKINTTNICGTIQDFPAYSAEEIDKYPPIVVVVPTELIWNKQLAIKTVSDHKTARELIAEAYSKISGKEVEDIMHFGYASQYIKEVHIEQLDEYKEMLILLRTILFLVLIMTMMGLTGMSVYFASERRQEIAVRKVFGGTIDTETVRNLLVYLRITLIADLIAIPLIYLIFKVFTAQPVAEKVESTWWIYIVAIVISLVISLAAVLWQTLRAARTNPAEALKKE